MNKKELKLYLVSFFAGSEELIFSCLNPFAELAKLLEGGLNISHVTIKNI